MRVKKVWICKACVEEYKTFVRDVVRKKGCAVGSALWVAKMFDKLAAEPDGSLCNGKDGTDY